MLIISDFSLSQPHTTTTSVSTYLPKRTAHTNLTPKKQPHSTTPHFEEYSNLTQIIICMLTEIFIMRTARKMSNTKNEHTQAVTNLYPIPSRTERQQSRRKQHPQPQHLLRLIRFPLLKKVGRKNLLIMVLRNRIVM